MATTPPRPAPRYQLLQRALPCAVGRLWSDCSTTVVNPWCTRGEPVVYPWRRQCATVGDEEGGRAVICSVAATLGLACSSRRRTLTGAVQLDRSKPSWAI